MAHNTQNKAGTLHIVATPIGNLEDITLRAIRILKEVDLIAAEDTRHTKKLLNHLGISTPLISYYREKEKERGQVIINRLLEGEDVALVSDAGTPAISDPGAILVQLALLNEIQISPIPGPSAITAALSSSGFVDSSFTFMGFLPPKTAQRKKALQSIVHTPHPVIFYEAPRRAKSFLKDALQILGERQTVWARELTKTYEELRKSTLSYLIDELSGSEVKGELVIIIGPAQSEEPQGENLEELLLWYRDNSELSLKDVCKKLADDLGLSRSNIYKQALVVWDKK